MPPPPAALFPLPTLPFCPLWSSITPSPLRSLGCHAVILLGTHFFTVVPDSYLLTVQDSVTCWGRYPLSLSLKDYLQLGTSYFVMISLLTCLLEYELPRAGTKSLWCLYLQCLAQWTPSDCLSLAWLGRFSFSPRGQTEGLSPVKTVKAIIGFPTEGREELASQSHH